jgi:hypothetical protein
MADTKSKATRTVKPVFAVMSVNDASGAPMEVSKDDVQIHGVYKNAEELLGVMESGGLPRGTFYKQIKLA